MNNNSPKIDVINAAIAFSVWLTALFIYYLTKAPTLSFWDCGEFIAASYILGVPHPPGTPLYILVGRVFSLIPFSDDIGVRVNMLSVIPSSFSALFGYLISVRILRPCFQNDNSLLTRIIIYAGGVSGALFMAFGLTNWNNSVEAEVYGLSMMMILAIFWLVMIYMEKKGTVKGERIMILVYFLAFAGIGVHMTTFIIMPAVALFIILSKEAPSKIWYAVAVFFFFELYLIFALSSRPNEIPYYVPVIFVLIFFLFYIFSFDRIPSLYQYVAGGFILSILPVFEVGINTFMNVFNSPLTSSSLGTLSIIGKVSFTGLVLFGIYLIIKYLSYKKMKKEKSQYLLSALFIFAAFVMAGILFAVKGYLAFLMITAFIIMILLIAFWKYINWAYLVATVSTLLVIIGVKEFIFGMVVGVIIILIVGHVFKQPGWKNALLIILVAILGYSTHLYIPLRSAHQPMINENNPSQNLTATINYIERKQYGSQSMIERMFKRRAEWVNQFGNKERMGFLRFFNEQYGLTGWKFIFPLIIGIFGVWEVLRKRAKEGSLLMVLLLITSIGLVLYMNFADGTRQHPVTGADHIEVRNRDYFFTPAFMFFGLAIGMGLSLGVQFAREAAENIAPKIRKVIIPFLFVLFLLPAFTLARNYYLSDRSKDYISYDYAWNILISADKDAVLFTSGDNDTFPLWCVQETYDVRKDVKVVNLSLANTKWYIKQIKSNLGIKLGWSNAQIDRLRVYRDPSGNVHRLQDQVITAIIRQNFGKRPINFCVTTPTSVRKYQGKSVDSLLSLNGMVWRMNQTGGGLRKDIESSIDLFTSPDKFKFRSIADPDVYKNETTFRLTRNYARGFMLVADSLKKIGEYEKVEWLVKKAIEFIPHSKDAINYLAAFYHQQGKGEELMHLINTTEYGEKRWLKTLLARIEKKQGNLERAEAIYKEIIDENPSYKPPFDELMRLYYDNKQPDKLKQVMRTWLEHNPDDKQIKMLLRSVDREFKKHDYSNDSS